MNNFKKKIILFVSITILLFFSQITFAQQNCPPGYVWNEKGGECLKTFAKVVEEIEAEVVKEVKNTFVVVSMYYEQNNIKNPEVVDEVMLNMIKACGYEIENYTLKNVSGISLDPNFTAICSSQANLTAEQVFKGDLISKITKIFSGVGSPNEEQQQKILEELNRIKKYFIDSKKMVQEKIGSVIYVDEINYEDYNIFKLFLPTTNEKQLLCVLSNPEYVSADQKCGLPGVPHYKVLFGKIFGGIFFDEGAIFHKVANISILNPILVFGIIMYSIIRIFFVFFILGKVYDIMFIPLRELDGKRKFILMLMKEHDLGTLMTDLLLSNKSNIANYNYKSPSFLPFKIGDDGNISYILHFFLFVAIYLVFEAFSGYLL